MKKVILYFLIAIVCLVLFYNFGIKKFIESKAKEANTKHAVVLNLNLNNEELAENLPILVAEVKTEKFKAVIKWNEPDFKGLRSLIIEQKERKMRDIIQVMDLDILKENFSGDPNNNMVIELYKHSFNNVERLNIIESSFVLQANTAE